MDGKTLNPDNKIECPMDGSTLTGSGIIIKNSWELRINGN
jgi:hypothetical protein